VGGVGVHGGAPGGCQEPALTGDARRGADSGLKCENIKVGMY